MSIGFQTEKKQEMPSKSPDDGDEVMRSSILSFSEEVMHGLSADFCLLSFSM